MKNKKLFNKIILFSLPIILIYGILFIRATQVLPQGAINLLPQIENPKEKEKIIIFSPHPDDETISCGGFIQRAIENKSNVYIVLITDGNRRHKKIVRYNEFKNATSHFGIKEENLIFLNYPDGKLFKYKNELYEDFYEIIKNYNPDIVFIPIIYDNHKDHKISGEILREVLSNFENIKVYQYLVHHDYFPQPLKYDPNLYILPPLRTLNFHSKWYSFTLTEKELEIKKEAIFMYKSQLIKIPLKEMLLSFIRKNEIFYVDNQKD
ncbi:MAG: PIG-L family deacetylase [Caldisericia bacterium]|nr:PIG-L family deacetylase [Caldisericia bacterium]